MKRVTKWWLPLLLWLGLASAVGAAPGLDIQARLEQSSDPLPFGKPATLILELSWDEGWPFQPPPADKLELPGFTIIDSFATSAADFRPGRQALTYTVVFTRFEPGKAKVPALEFQTPAGKVKSRSLNIVYKGAEAQEGDKPDQLRGPKDVAELSTGDFWKWLAKVSGLAFLVLLLLAALTRKLGFLERWLSPRSRALRQLGRLSKGLEKGTAQAPAAVLELVEITRVYLHRAYGLVTREATTGEIAQQLTMNNRCQGIKPVARAVLEQGDAAKFAQREPSNEQAQDLLEQLRSALLADKKRKTP